MLTRLLRLAGCLFELLLPRAPLLGFNSFLGLLFALNGCTHAPHHPRPLPEPERKVVEMAGEGKQRRRLQILRLLLQHMSDEQKLQITVRWQSSSPASSAPPFAPEQQPFWYVGQAVPRCARGSAGRHTAARVGARCAS